MAPFLGDALGRLLARGLLKIFRPGLGFHLLMPVVADNLAFFIHPIAGAYLTGPTLFVFDLGHNFMRRLNVESSVRLNHFFRIGMRPVDHNVDVEIFRIAVRRNDRLVAFQAHTFQKHSYSFHNLLAAGDFIFLPAHDPVTDRHFALYGFFGQRHHFVFPRRRGRGQEVQAVGIEPFLIPRLVFVGKHIVHQTTDHGGLGFAEIGALQLFENHAVLLSASMASRIARRTRLISSRSSGLPAALTVSK